MYKLFDILFLDEAFEFLKNLERKQYEKVLFNIRKAQTGREPELFKKLRSEIWEFRTAYQGIQYRLLAFWDKSGNEKTLVICTHGFVKKSSKLPERELEKAIQMRARYFIDKQLSNSKRK
ncbi:MAG: type II toxin-antitoxin system RelE/ParE family toxin [Bacteroidales bacterium]|nr:type II toxin-antitoxin system RelE/ParE family toxin [Bacteroidales bacterium]